MRGISTLATGCANVGPMGEGVSDPARTIQCNIILKLWAINSHRPAQKNDSRFIAEMIDVSSDRIALIDWMETAQALDNKNALEVGAEKYSSDKADYSYRNCYIAEHSGRLAGMLLSFAMIQGSQVISSRPCLLMAPTYLHPISTLKSLIVGTSAVSR